MDHSTSPSPMCNPSLNPFTTLKLHQLLLQRVPSTFSKGKAMASEVSTQQPYGDLYLEGKISEIHNQSIIFSFVIFSFLAFFALCFIYTLYLCTHRWQNAVADQQRLPVVHAISNQSATIQMPQLGHEIGPFFGHDTRLGLDQVAINSLPIVSYGSTNFSKEVDCSICLSNFQYGEKVRLLPECCHAFHSECLDKWLVNQSNCPLCRAQVLSPDPAR